MPWKLVEQLLEAHSQRLAADDLRAHRSAMVSGIWANPNFEEQDGKNPRQDLLDDIDSWYRKQLDAIYGRSEQEEDLSQDPFFAGMRLPPEPEKATSASGPMHEGDAVVAKLREDEEVMHG